MHRVHSLIHASRAGDVGPSWKSIFLSIYALEARVRPKMMLPTDEELEERGGNTTLKPFELITSEEGRSMEGYPGSERRTPMLSGAL